MPLFSAGGMTSSVPYQPGSFAFDTVPVNPYNMQQTSYFSPNIPHAVSYAPDTQPLSTVRDDRGSFIMERSGMVKSEGTSPMHPNPMYSDVSYAAGFNRSTSEPTEANATNFATDVDTLMKAIQAKQTSSPQPPEQPKVCVSPLTSGL